MSPDNRVAASFSLLRDATAAIDWLRNQKVAPEQIIVAALPPGERPRLPQRGDNARADLTWIVAVNLDDVKLPRSVVRETFVREGGTNLSDVPTLPAPARS